MTEVEQEKEEEEVRLREFLYFVCVQVTHMLTISWDTCMFVCVTGISIISFVWLVICPV